MIQIWRRPRGRISASVCGGHLPQHRGYPFATGGILGDVPRFPSPWFLSSCPRISSWPKKSASIPASRALESLAKIEQGRIIRPDLEKSSQKIRPPSRWRAKSP
jgi:hypothetical protein